MTVATMPATVVVPITRRLYGIPHRVFVVNCRRDLGGCGFRNENREQWQADAIRDRHLCPPPEEGHTP